MAGMFSDSLLGKTLKFGSKVTGTDFVNKLAFGNKDPLNLFAKTPEGKKASTGAAINQGAAGGTSPAKRKAVRQRIAPTNTPLSSDPNNPLGGR